MSIATTITTLEPGENLRTALETEAVARLLGHPQCVEFPELGTGQIGTHDIENGQFFFHDSDEGLVLVLETSMATFTLWPNDTLTRRSKFEG